MSLLVLATWICPTSAQQVPVPGEISYQGRLTDNARPVPSPVDGVLPMEFGIYGSPFGNDILWEESWDAVPVDNGIFNVMLGSNGSPLPSSLFANHSELYLEVEVDGDTLAPRQRIGSVGYAHRAATAENAETMEGLGAGAWQRRVAENCPPGSSIRQIASEGTIQCQPDEIGILSESDPQVGVVATDGVPRWDGNALISGSIFDDGTRVDFGVNRINLGAGSPAGAGVIFEQGQMVNPEFRWDPLSHRFRLTGSPGTASPAFRNGAMDGLEFRPLDGWYLGYDRTGIWFPLTHPKSTYWFAGVIATDVGGNSQTADNVLCWAYNSDCSGGRFDMTEHAFKLQLEATFSPASGSPSICGPTGDEACSQIEWNIDYIPVAGPSGGAAWRPLAFHLTEESQDLDGAASLRWSSFRLEGTRSHFRVSKTGRVRINGDGSFAVYPLEVFGDTRFIGGDLRIDPGREILWTEQGGDPSAPDTRILADLEATEDVTLILPGNIGTAGDYLLTDGMGKLSFSAPLFNAGGGQGIVMWSDATDVAYDSGDEVCASLGRQCTMTVDVGATGAVACNVSHGGGDHGGATHLFQAFCE